MIPSGFYRIDKYVNCFTAYLILVLWENNLVSAAEKEVAGWWKASVCTVGLYSKYKVKRGRV